MSLQSIINWQASPLLILTTPVNTCVGQKSPTKLVLELWVAWYIGLEIGGQIASLDFIQVKNKTICAR